MLTPGGKVFLHVPDGTHKRELHEGEVVECNAQSFVARFSCACTAAPEPGVSVLAYAEVKRKFMQQSATVTAVMQTEPNHVLAFARVGEPISAESRNAYRVCTAASSLTATVNDEPDCPLLDVSATGFAVQSRQTFQVGVQVRATLTHEGQSFSGPARVQSVRELGPGKFRYGLHALESGRGARASDLQQGVAKISAAVQREQLKRLARA